MNPDMPITTSMRQQLIQFLIRKSIIANQWLEDEFIKVYVRINRLYKANGEQYPVFQIANVEVREDVRNKGHFKGLIRTAEVLCQEYRPDLQGIFIENVQEEPLRRTLERWGFDAISSSGWQPGIDDCFFTPLPPMRFK